jgi:hypothetical protein
VSGTTRGQKHHFVRVGRTNVVGWYYFTRLLEIEYDIFSLFKLVWEQNIISSNPTQSTKK